MRSLDVINLPQKHKFDTKGFEATLLRADFERALEHPFDITEMKIGEDKVMITCHPGARLDRPMKFSSSNGYKKVRR